MLKDNPGGIDMAGGKEAATAPAQAIAGYRPAKQHSAAQGTVNAAPALKLNISLGDPKRPNF
jgi:hypothetical protein